MSNNNANETTIESYPIRGLHPKQVQIKDRLPSRHVGQTSSSSDVASM